MPNRVAKYSSLGTLVLAAVALSLSLWMVSLADWPRAIGYAIGGCIAVGYSIVQRKTARASADGTYPSFVRGRRLAEQKKFRPDLTSLNPTPHIGIVRGDHEYGAYVFLQRRPRGESYWLGISREFDRHSNMQFSSVSDLRTFVDGLDVAWIPPGKIHHQIMKDRFRSFRLHLFMLRLTNR